jgi:hypothetical protein
MLRRGGRRNAKRVELNIERLDIRWLAMNPKIIIALYKVPAIRFGHLKDPVPLTRELAHKSDCLFVRVQRPVTSIAQRARARKVPSHVTCKFPSLIDCISLRQNAFQFNGS